VKKILDTHKNDYEQLWLTENGSLNQSWQWGETRRFNHALHRFEHDGYPITIYVRTMPVFKKQFGYVPRMHPGLVSDVFLNEMHAWSKQAGLSHVVIEPQLLQYDLSSEMQEKYRLRSPTIQPEFTMVNDLSRSEEEILAGMRTNHRQYIRKAGRNGIEYSTGTSREFYEDFYSVMDSIIQRTGVSAHNKAYFDSVYEAFGGTDYFDIHIARQNGSVVSGLFCIRNSDRTYEWNGGATQIGMRQKAGYGLKWYAMQYAKEKGCKSYDHWGVSPYKNGEFDHGHSMYNISIYKKGFGGVIEQYCPQIIIDNDKLYARAVDVAVDMHKQALKMKRKLRFNKI